MSSIPRWRYLRELERDPLKRNGVRSDDADSDSGDDFEYVSEVAMCRKLGCFGFRIQWYIRMMSRRI